MLTGFLEGKLGIGFSNVQPSSASLFTGSLPG